MAGADSHASRLQPQCHAKAAAHWSNLHDVLCRSTLPRPPPPPLLPQTGMCWQQPQKDADCSAALAPNSYVVLGDALPAALDSTSQLSSVPLYNATFPANPPPAGASTHTFRPVLRCPWAAMRMGSQRSKSAWGQQAQQTSWGKLLGPACLHALCMDGVWQ